MRADRRRAFTMIELMGVVVIIGLLMIFVLVAAQGANRDAQRESTRSLIVKLEQAMNSLLDSVQTTRNTPTNTHILWASYITTNGQLIGSFTDKATLQRAQVLANYDQIRAEVPDVFWIQDTSLTSTGYPINFAQQAFTTGNGAPWDYVLPLGVNTPYNLSGGGGAITQPITPGTGIYGASYGAAAGLLKNLGNVPPAFVTSGLPPAQLLPQGADGVDNDGDGFIDNIGEGYIVGGNSQPAVHDSIFASLIQHKHNTARSEMLYALLVEGQSQYGAFLSRDDFTDQQVKDTDNDGLPEFVDAWGNPLQFFRWPVFYHSDVQRGVPYDTVNQAPLNPYLNVFETREQDTYDPNQQLMSVSWWSGAQNGGPNAITGPMAIGFQGANQFMSGPAFMFQRYFHTLVEPMSVNGASPPFFWDRSPQFFQRRAYYTRFLILSGGPDGVPGVPILSDVSLQGLMGGGITDAVSSALQLEGQAAQYDLNARLQNPASATLFGPPLNWTSSDDSTSPQSGLAFFDMGLDDITNHNLNSTAQVSAQ